MILDMGSTSALTPHKSNYLNIMIKSNPKKLKGFARVFAVDGIGMVEYTIRYYRGIKINFRLWALYVPKLSSDSSIISPLGIKTVEGHKETFK